MESKIQKLHQRYEDANQSRYRNPANESQLQILYSQKKSLKTIENSILKAENVTTINNRHPDNLTNPHQKKIKQLI